MKFESMLHNIAADLNDAEPGHEFTTWTQAQIANYIREAIRVAFVERADLFVETKILKVTACQHLVDTCDCTHVRRVLWQSDKDGNPLHMLRVRKNSDKLVWRGMTCPVNPRDFKLEEYSIDNVTDKLWVYPQVPGGIDVYIAVECSVLPDEIGDDYEIPNELDAAVVQWVLWRAKSVDAETNATANQVANMHQDTFWKLLNAQLLYDELKAEKDEADARTTNNRRV